MKRLSILVLALTLLLFTYSAAAEAVDEYAMMAETGRDALLGYWGELYSDPMYDGHTGYLEIKNTRLFKISDNPVSNVMESIDETARDLFGNVDYVAEFVIFSDYMLTEPYYWWIGMCDHVVFFHDGSTSVMRNPFDIYRSRTYCTDFTGIIDEIVDFDATYNAVYHLRN